MGASNGPGDLDEAATVVVSSGNVDVASADAIQDISGYVGTMSDYDITDTSAAIISAGDAVLDAAGVDVVTVTGGSVNADDGAVINNVSATIEFDIDKSAEIVENTASLGEANSVVVTGSAKADALNEAEYQTL